MGSVTGGRLVRVDVSSGVVTEEPIDGADLGRFPGGSALGARLLCERDPRESEPLDASSSVVLAPGLLTGTGVPTASRLSVCARSPLTGIWNEATVGGFFGSKLKSAGYDAVVISGRAGSPVCVDIGEGGARIVGAGHLWGRDTYETEALIREDAGSQAQVLCIGQAGENLVQLAGAMTGGRHTRAAARGGLGAVMGSKLVKAVIVRGAGRPAVHDKEALRASVREFIPRARMYTKRLSSFGTAGSVEAKESTGDLPIRNWVLGKWEDGARKVCGQSIAEAYSPKHYACDSCAIACGKTLKISSGPLAGLYGHGPEYETVAAFGSLCLCDDLDAVILANDMCNRYGLDTMSVGSAIAFAMECFEAGRLSARDADGLDLRWGSKDAILGLVRKIAVREGIGELLGKGVREAARVLGAEEFAVHVKGLEVAMHDPRAYTSQAVSYATGNRGACHLESQSHQIEGGTPLPDLGLSGPYEPHSSCGKAELAVKMQNLMTLYNALGVCKFLLSAQVGPELLARWTRLCTGWDVSEAELMEAGERAFSLKRLYNARLGISRKDDWLPARLLTCDRKEGGAAGSLPHLGRMLNEYYALRGWSETGIPLRAKLEALGLADFEAGWRRSSS